MASKLVIRQRRSSADGANRPQRETLRSLGLRGIGKSAERAGRARAPRHDAASSAHLIEVEEASDG